MFRFHARLMCGVSSCIFLSNVSSALAHTDVTVGRSANDQLKISPPGSGGFVPEEEILVLTESEFLSGWTDIEPGFFRLAMSQPDFDFFTLGGGASVRIVVVESDPGFKAYTPNFTVLQNPGDNALLLNDQVNHRDLTWHIDSDDPAFDPMRVLWRVTYKLVDTGSTAYAESAPFTFFFANVDCTRGDCNGDGMIDGADVQDFVRTILDPASRTATDRCAADMDRDGYATLEDVAPFVDTLLNL